MAQKNRLEESNRLLRDVLQVRRLTAIPYDIATDFGLKLNLSVDHPDFDVALAEMPKATRKRMIGDLHAELELRREDSSRRQPAFA